MSEKQLARLKSSMEKYGFIIPIITNRDLLVADGEQRLTVAKSLGMDKVPTIRLDVEDVDRRLLRQVLNKLRGEHELIADAREFERIIKMGHEDELKHLLDLSDSQLERYLAEIRELKDEDYLIPEIDKIKTDIRRGDIIKLGNHRLICGDATSKTDVKQLMNGQKADMVFTDPPFGVNYAGKSTLPSKVRQDAFNDTFEDYTQFSQSWLKNLQFNGHNTIYIWINGANVRQLMNAAQNEGIKLDNLLIWVKQSAVASRIDYWSQHEICLYGWKGRHKYYGRKGKPNVLFYDRPTISPLHPVMKPLKMCADLITDGSVKSETVLDLFGGSGSTLIACEQTGRHCYMMEIDPRYCQVIVNRWENYTNQKAILIKNNGEE